MSDFIMPNIPDDDVSPLSPDFKWLWIMIWIIIWVWVFSYIFFYWFAKIFISKMDLEDEKKYFSNFFIESTDNKYDFSNISYKINLPKNIDVYVKDSEEINAFASIWWNIIFTTELLKNIKYEEEFLFILWHELSHIENRDPIKNFATQLPFYVSMSFFWIDPSINYDKIFKITTNYMSKKIELRSDNDWVNFVKNIWWNPFCATHFFEEKDNIFSKYLIFDKTHPDNIDRLENIKKLSKQKTFDNCKKFEFIK